MKTLKDCRRCRRFHGIVFVHPESLGVSRYKFQHGWYVNCGEKPYDTYEAEAGPQVNIHGVACHKGGSRPDESCQAMQWFMKINANCQVDCPRHKEKQPNLSAKQVNIFDYVQE